MDFTKNHYANEVGRGKEAAASTFLKFLYLEYRHLDNVNYSMCHKIRLYFAHNNYHCTESGTRAKSAHSPLVTVATRHFVRLWKRVKL